MKSLKFHFILTVSSIIFLRLALTLAIGLPYPPVHSICNIQCKIKCDKTSKITKHHFNRLNFKNQSGKTIPTEDKQRIQSKHSINNMLNNLILWSTNINHSQQTQKLNLIKKEKKAKSKLKEENPADN